MKLSRTLYSNYKKGGNILVFKTIYMKSMKIKMKNGTTQLGALVFE
jgi:hypothetical protein